MNTPKPSLVMLKHSRLMDALVTHDDERVRVAAATFNLAFIPPADLPRFRLGLARLETGLVTLADTAPNLRGIVNFVHTGVKRLKEVVANLEDDPERATEKPTMVWLKSFPQYAALVLSVDDDIESLQALAAAFVRFNFSGKKLPKPFVNAILRESHSPASRLSLLPQKPHTWEQSHATTLRWLTTLVAGGPDESQHNFQLAAVRHYLSRSKTPGLNARRHLVDDRSLTQPSFTDAALEIRYGIIETAPLAIAIAAGFLSGLTWNLSQGIPLSQPEGNDWIIWLDIPGECFHFDLNPLVRGAATAKGNKNYVPATRRFKRFVPTYLAKALRRRDEIRPDSKTLGELCESADIPPEHRICALDDRVMKTSIARFYNSRSHVSGMLGLSAPITTLALGELARLPHSRMFYHASTQQQLNEAQTALAGLLDWGDIPPTEFEQEFLGPAVVPEAKTIASIARTLAAAAEAALPPKRYQLEHLKRFHNAITDYTVFVVSLGALGRDRVSLAIQALGSISETGLAGLHDKRTPASRDVHTGSSPVAMCKVVRAQIDFYIKHCKFLLGRLEKRGEGSDAIRARLKSVIDGTATDPFFLMDDLGRAPRRGTRGVYAELPHDLKIKADAARAFWDTTLGQMGVDDDFIDAQARRSVRWIRRWTSTGTKSIEAMRSAVSAAQDQVFEHLQIHAVRGLRK